MILCVPERNSYQAEFPQPRLSSRQGISELDEPNHAEAAIVAIENVPPPDGSRVHLARPVNSQSFGSRWSLRPFDSASLFIESPKKAFVKR